MRDKRYDGLRGLFLIIMCIDHFQSPLIHITHETFGFIDAAYGFVIISGFIAGMVYGRKNADQRLRSRLTDRSVLIYRYHIITFLFFLFIVSVFRYYMEFWSSVAPGLSNDPIMALIKGFLLLYQPHPLDILPMYVIFVLLLFPMLKWLQQGKIIRYFFLSTGLYLCVQVFRALSGLNISFAYLDFDAFAAFNVFAWQMVFFLAVWLGHNHLKVSQYLQQNKWIGNYAFILVLMFFIGKHSLVVFNYFAASPFELPYIFISKRNAGILSLVNAMVFGLSLHYVFNRLTFLQWRIFTSLGSISMKAFAIHLVTYMLFYPVAMWLASVNTAIEVLFTFFMVGAMYLPYLLKDESIVSSFKYLFYKLHY